MHTVYITRTILFQPVTLMKVRSSRVSSAAACSRTLRDRTKMIGRMRASVSGGESMVQLSREVTSITSEYRKHLLDEIFKQPGRFLIEIPPTESLALKSDLQLPWAKLREMRRYRVEQCTLFICGVHSLSHKMDEVLGSCPIVRAENEICVFTTHWAEPRS